MPQIYFLSEYNWLQGNLLKTNKATFKIEVSNNDGTSHTRLVRKEKCAFPEERVCVVWETWRGCNGRGGYRVEKFFYRRERVLASLVARQSHGPGRVVEDKSTDRA